MSELPKGFYTGPDGKERFWDGQEWFDSSQKSTKKSAIAPPGDESSRPKSRRRIIIIGAGILLAIIIGATSVVITTAHNADVAAQELALKEKQQAEERRLDMQRDIRKSKVPEIEASVKTMAEKNVADGLIDGPITSVKCTTAGGVSIDDLDIQSMLFECFATYRDNGDGTSSGYYYHARANWDDFSWTYGFGRAE